MYGAILTFATLHCEFHIGLRGAAMSSLSQRGHFLGTKLRAVRKRNGLTLEELSARCVQRQVQHAPSISYLSMIEAGKRFPSREVLLLLSQVFQKEPSWFLDEHVELE